MSKPERPQVLPGNTYKIKPPETVSLHAIYVTINDCIVDEGGEERRRPYEIFINSKNLDHFQWIVALTRVISAVFRHEGDVKFLVEELKSVFDPRGGYFKPGSHGLQMPSLVAEIGYVLEEHFLSLGLIDGALLGENQRAYIQKPQQVLGPPAEEEEPSGGPDNA